MSDGGERIHVYVSRKNLVDKINSRDQSKFPKPVDYINAAILSFEDQESNLLSEKKFLEVAEQILDEIDKIPKHDETEKNQNWDSGINVI